MTNFAETAGIIAGILSLVGYIPYVFEAVKGVTRPNQATWIIWTLVGGLLAFSYLAEQGLSSSWLPLGYFVGPFIVACLTFYYGYAGWNKLDIICLVAALLSVIPWFFSKNSSYTLLINIFIDATGAIPTLIKTYHEPETEDFTAWLIFFIANTIQLFAVTRWNIASLYPIYLFLLAGSLVIFIIKGKLKKI
ncbi:MAG: hypothetical protein JO131_03530 [Gammaproteobacteria bacterium]|nr:hypothetical protein [Gammaproteobacteria bacterium]